MTRQFRAHFENGVIVPNETVELPEREEFVLTVLEKNSEKSAAPARNSFDEAMDSRPKGGAGLIDWWERHRIQLDPAMLDKIVRSKAYEYNEEPDDES